MVVDCMFDVVCDVFVVDCNVFCVCDGGCFGCDCQCELWFVLMMVELIDGVICCCVQCVECCVECDFFLDCGLYVGIECVGEFCV